jgi:hypothetical protein
MTYAPETAAAASTTTGPTNRPPAQPADAPLPVVDDPGLRVTRPREIRRQARRRFLQTMGAVGVGVGLAFTDGLSTRFARPAGALPYEMWRDCQGYFISSTTCVPSNAYYGTEVCDADAWHRNDFILVPISPEMTLVGYYIHLGETCRGRNAWLWTWSIGVATKCSDGNTEVWSWPTTGEGALLARDFSICRTTGFF